MDSLVAAAVVEVADPAASKGLATEWVGPPFRQEQAAHPGIRKALAAVMAEREVPMEAVARSFLGAAAAVVA